MRRLQRRPSRVPPQHVMSLFTLLSLLLFLTFTPHGCQAKRVSGDFQLTGEFTEHVLTTFAVVPNGGAMMRLNLTTAGVYGNDRLLAVYFYRDVEWPKVLKGNMCTDKTPHAKQYQRLSFSERDEKHQKWKTPEINIILVNDDGGLELEKKKNKHKKIPAVENRAHYWYVVISDCHLEQTNYLAKVPPIHFDLEIFNQIIPPNGQPNAEPRLTQFSADELWLYRYHGFTFCVSLGVTVWLCTVILQKVSSSRSNAKSSLHVTILWVTLAAWLDTLSALLELLHLRIYESNGIGSYALDALSAHSEAIADALAAMLLWCLGSGWTLTAEIQERALHSTTPVARLYHDWRHPFGHYSSSSSSSSVKSALIGPGHVLMLLVLSSHIILAQWGRIYNDNFDSYHDYEHGPGRALMWLRLLSGALFGLATWQTIQGLKQHSSGKMLSDFYQTLLICGVVWFTGLPLLTLWAKTLPYYLRNGVVVIGSSVLQASVLASLAYLVTFSEALAKVNASGSKTHANDVLPGSLGTASAPQLFSFGLAKIRLD